MAQISSPTRAKLLALARERLKTPREASILIAHALGISREALYAHPEITLDREQAAHGLDYVQRRARGEPVAYILGTREFYGLKLRVTPAVLIPRPETELLVELSLERIASLRKPRVVELGTGSGAIAIALARECPKARITATDYSLPALRLAHANARQHDAGGIDFVQADWFAPFGEEYFDLVVSNPPYIAAGDPHLDTGDLVHEPRIALVAGREGLDALARVIAAAPSRLRPGGWLVLEHGAEQQPSLGRLLRKAGFKDIGAHHDLAGLPRAISARRPG